MDEPKVSTHEDGPEIGPILVEPQGSWNGELKPEEVWWHDRYGGLEEQGYVLRSRYTPDWVPSWTTKHKPYWKCDDGQAILVRDPSIHCEPPSGSTKPILDTSRSPTYWMPRGHQTANWSSSRES